MNPAELHTTFCHSDLLDDKAERLRRRRERNRDWRAAETDEQRDCETGLSAVLCSVERDTYCTMAQEGTTTGETGKRNSCAETGQAAADERLSARETTTPFCRLRPHAQARPHDDHHLPSICTNGTPYVSAP